MADASSAAAAVTLASLAQKLRHDLLEVRERALHSLAFKLDNNLLRLQDVGASEATLRSLLEWFNMGETGAREVEVLAMLRRIANEHPPSVARLLALGADRFLRDLCANGCVATPSRLPPAQKITIVHQPQQQAFFSHFQTYSVVALEQPHSTHAHTPLRVLNSPPSPPNDRSPSQQRQAPLGDDRGAD
jgi:hypothetical protein